MSIRRFPAERLKADDLVTLRALTQPMLDFLSHCVKARLNGADQRRHRRRQDDAAERALELHLRARAHRHHRRRGRTAAPPGARRAARNAAAERRRQGRGPAAPADGQRPAYAPRPHRRRRGARRGSARHAAGDEHRPRRLADHRPRQHAARRADPYRDDDRDGRDQPAGAGDAPADLVGDPARRPADAPQRRHRARSPASPRSPAWKAT